MYRNQIFNLNKLWRSVQEFSTSHSVYKDLKNVKVAPQVDKKYALMKREDVERHKAHSLETIKIDHKVCLFSLGLNTKKLTNGRVSELTTPQGSSTSTLPKKAT